MPYTYDAAGNRLKTGGTFVRSNIPPALTTTTYNANNQQTAFGTTTETCDLNGNLATSTDTGVTTTYTWNARNQLTAISRTGLTASFTYDSFGRRTGQTINGTTTNFLYDGLNPVQEKNGATVTANLLTGLGIDEFFTRTEGGVARSLLPDALGSTVALGDGTGTLQTQYTYEPFGFTTQTGAASTSSYKYTGREDDGTGLYYYRARYYEPRLQRFIAEDPIEFSGGDMNLYGYVANSPTNEIDPEGLFSLQDAGNLAAGFADPLTLSGTYWIRVWMGTDPQVNKCSAAYQSGGWLSFVGGVTRLTYAGLAKGYSLIAPSGAAASSYRSQLRVQFGGGPNLRPPNLAKYKNDDELRAGAGRTNPYVNALGAGSAIGGAYVGTGCGCPPQ